MGRARAGIVVCGFGWDGFRHHGFRHPGRVRLKERRKHPRLNLEIFLLRLAPSPAYLLTPPPTPQQHPDPCGRPARSPPSSSSAPSASAVRAIGWWVVAVGIASRNRRAPTRAATGSACALIRLTHTHDAGERSPCQPPNPQTPAIAPQIRTQSHDLHHHHHHSGFLAPTPAQTRSCHTVNMVRTWARVLLCVMCMSQGIKSLTHQSNQSN